MEDGVSKETKTRALDKNYVWDFVDAMNKSQASTVKNKSCN
jgi:hypothetical protein